MLEPRKANGAQISVGTLVAAVEKSRSRIVGSSTAIL
jgi:hypothetical protein